MQRGLLPMADILLVLMPHETLHGTISILVHWSKRATDVGKLGPIIFWEFLSGDGHRLSMTQSAAAQMPGDSWPTILPCSTSKA